MSNDALDHENVLRALLQVDSAALLLAVAEATRDSGLLHRMSGYVTNPAELTDSFPEDARRELAEIAAEMFLTGDFAHDFPLSSPDDAAAHPFYDELCRVAACRDVGTTEKILFLKEMGLMDGPGPDWRGPRPLEASQIRVGIVGAGISGIAIAVGLKRLGIDFVIYEQNDDIGGTWLVNTYPGCGVDIQSHYFSYSFNRKPDWNDYYGSQQDILDYLRSTVRDFDLKDRIQLGTSVTCATYESDDATWQLDLRDATGERTEKVNILISAVGALSIPSVPNIPGREKFRGRMVHSAEWDVSIEVEGKNVVLVGNGASANQIGPKIAPKVEHLTVLTRSPQWVTPTPRYGDPVPESEKWALENIEAYARWYRVRTMLGMNDVMRPNAVLDPEFAQHGMVNAGNEMMRERLTSYIKDELADRQDLAQYLIPTYPPGMKRMLRDNGWCRMFTRQNVKLAPSRAAEMTENAVVDSEGNEHAADVVIFATGFNVARMVGSFEVHGKNGTLREAWGEDDPRAYLGVSVPSFPNFFVLYGPNTNVGVGGSGFFQVEAQCEHVLGVIRDMVEQNATTVEVREEIFRDYNRDLDAELDTLIWSLPVGSTWYKNSRGRVVANMPWTSLDFWSRSRDAGIHDYRLISATERQEPSRLDSAGIERRETGDVPSYS